MPSRLSQPADEIGLGPCGHCLLAVEAFQLALDAFRLRHLEGADLANEALKRWLRRGGQPSELLALARSFPRALTALRDTLEILL